MNTLFFIILLILAILCYYLFFKCSYEALQDFKFAFNEGFFIVWILYLILCIVTTVLTYSSFKELFL